MIKLKPLGNRVIVQRSKVKATKGGILLPDSAQEKPKEGKIVACGPGKQNDTGETEPMSVKMGDTVLFGSYAGTEVKDMGEEDEFLILAEDGILGIIE